MTQISIELESNFFQIAKKDSGGSFVLQSALSSSVQGLVVFQCKPMSKMTLQVGSNFESRKVKSIGNRDFHVLQFLAHVTR